MTRWFLAVAIALSWTAPSAHAQALRLQLEVWAERCNNANGEFPPDVAAQACTAIIRSDSATSPARAFAYQQRGAIRLDLGDQARALEDFSDAVRYNPHYAQGYISRAALYEARGEYERAVADYDQVVRLMPEQAVAYNARCWLRAVWGRQLDLARTDCDRARALAPDDPNVHDTRGMLGLREEDFEAAWEAYDAAVRADPSSAHFLYGRGIAALRLGRGEEARADLNAAVSLDADIAQTYASYGVTP